MKNSKRNLVAGAMHKEHLRIEKLLDNYIINLKRDPKRAREFFEKFEWNFKKHIYMEEEIMYTKSHSIVISEETSELVEGHEEMIRIIERIKKDKIEDIQAEAKLLRDILKKHSRREEELLHEELEKSLSKEQKQKILDHTKDFI